MQLDPTAVVPSAELQINLDDTLVVTERFKRLLEEMNMRHVQFQPTVIRPDPKKERKVPVPKDPFWEVTTDFCLPRVSSTMYLRNNNGDPINGNEKLGCFLCEGLSIPESLYAPLELHYTATALQNAGQFDLAQTHERTGIGDASRWTPYWVVSKQFFNFCQEQDLDILWVPVRIEGEMSDKPKARSISIQ
ncbi:MAG: hypothetical protein M3Y13_03825 [Armatimonadota bacterium]|nr:hypothetical protein [Armatimonadota bacterium]